MRKPGRPPRASGGRSQDRASPGGRSSASGLRPPEPVGAVPSSLGLAQPFWGPCPAPGLPRGFTRWPQGRLPKHARLLGAPPRVPNPVGSSRLTTPPHPPRLQSLKTGLGSPLPTRDKRRPPGAARGGQCPGVGPRPAAAGCVLSLERTASPGCSVLTAGLFDGRTGALTRPLCRANSGSRCPEAALLRGCRVSPGLCAGLLQPDGLRVSTPKTSEPPARIFKERQGPGRDHQVCGARRGEPSLLTLTGRVLCSGEGTLSTPETRHHQPAALVTEDAVTTTRHRHRPRVKNHRHLGPAPQGPWAVSPRDETGVPRIRPHPEKWLGRQGKPPAGAGGAGPRPSPRRPVLRRAWGQTSDCAPAPSVSGRARRQQT